VAMTFLFAPDATRDRCGAFKRCELGLTQRVVLLIHTELQPDVNERWTIDKEPKVNPDE
jgi:hypothetical protein